MKNRRHFFKTSGALLLGSTISSNVLGSSIQKKSSPIPLAKIKFQLGLASYTTREFSLDDTVKMAQRVGLTRIGLKSFHLPLTATESDCMNVASKLKQQGLDFYNVGVIYMKTKEEIDQAFNYAKACAVKIIIGVPAHELLEYAQIKVKETGINLAIHNHGPGDKLYPTVESIYEKIKLMDKGMGICMDIGHIVRLNGDPSQELKKFFDRIMEIHIKDEDQKTAEGKPVEIGRGITDIPDFLRTVIELNYSGGISFEYEKDAKDPLPGLAESVGYIKGVLAAF